MNILLVNPPAENTLEHEVPSIVDQERGFNPPLGLMYVAAYSESNTSHKIGILDAQVEQISHKSLSAEIKRRHPDIVGISAMTFTLVDSLITAKAIKAVDPDIKIVFGGPHPNIYPNETIKFSDVDYVVLGEGEHTFAKLLDNIDDAKSLESIKGLIFKDKDRVVNTGQSDLIQNLDTLPFPARHLTPYCKYSSLLAKRTPVTTMITSRGCPYKCSFCNREWLGKSFRARSAVNVADEMEACIDMGIHEFLIYDDTFTIDQKRVLDICSEIKKRDLDVGWDVRARVNTVDAKLLDIMRNAGCERIHFGVESGNDEILRIIQKGITKNQCLSAFEAARKVGVETLAYFMIGSPRETRDTIKESIEFAKALRPDYVHFSITMPFPSTELYERGIKEGIIKRDYWREYATTPSLEFKPPIWEENLKREELVYLLHHAYKSFYTRPSYILKELSRVRSASEFFRKMNAGLKLMRGLF